MEKMKKDVLLALVFFLVPLHIANPHPIFGLGVAKTVWWQSTLGVPVFVWHTFCKVPPSSHPRSFETRHLLIQNAPSPLLLGFDDFPYLGPLSNSRRMPL